MGAFTHGHWFHVRRSYNGFQGIGDRWYGYFFARFRTLRYRPSPVSLRQTEGAIFPSGTRLKQRKGVCVDVRKAILIVLGVILLVLIGYLQMKS